MENIDIEFLYGVIESLDLEPFPYPKYLGNGVYEIVEGVYGGRRLVEEINEEIRDYVSED